MALGAGVNCSYFTGRSGAERSPFDFWVTGGSRAQAVCQAGGGAYVFPDAACGGEAQWDSRQCCNQAGWSKSFLANNLVGIGGSIVLMSFIMAMRKAGIKKSSSPNFMVWWQRVLLYAGIFAYTVIMAMMARLTQNWLSVNDRNAMLAAGAFLTPVRDAFQFLEDSVSVQIGYALASGKAEVAISILILGVIGGLFFGVMGAVAMTALTFWPSAIRFLLSPASAQNAVALPNCGLVGTAEEVVEAARFFWLLTVWSWPLSFAGMALVGYMFGTRRIGVLGLSWALESVAQLLIWLLFRPKSLDLLAWANFAPSAVRLLVCGGAVALAPEARAALRPAWALLFGDTAREDGVRRKALTDGALAMALDLSTQLSITIGVYVGGCMGVSSQYQLSALQAALPTYSTAISFALGFVAKMRGSFLVGSRDYEGFQHLVRLMVVAGVALAALAVAAVLPNRDSLAFEYAENACEYASSEACAPAYIGIFGDGAGGGGTLQTSFGVFAVVAASQVIYLIARAGLYACQDFKFLAKLGGASLALVFAPAICLAHFAVGSPAAVFAAMYAPSIVLAVMFSARLFYNTHQMAKGVEGPWSQDVPWLKEDASEVSVDESVSETDSQTEETASDGRERGAP